MNVPAHRTANTKHFVSVGDILQHFQNSSKNGLVDLIVYLIFRPVCLKFKWHVRTCINCRPNKTFRPKNKYYSYCRDVPQRPTANSKHHNHGRRRHKWPSSSSAPHEAFRPAPMPMRQSNRGRPSEQADMIFTGVEEFLVDCCLVLPPSAAMATVILVLPVVIVALPLSSSCPSPAGRHLPSPHSLVDCCVH